MLYIQIPLGWHFVTIEDQDCLRHDENLDKIISLQTLIKEELRHHQRGQHAISIRSSKTHDETLTLYFRRSVALLETPLLEYLPQRNGKLKCEHAVLIGCEPKKKIAKEDYLGRLWFHQDERTLELSAEKKQELIDSARQQKEDRQHFGDSPKPT